MRIQLRTNAKYKGTPKPKNSTSLVFYESAIGFLTI